MLNLSSQSINKDLEEYPLYSIKLVNSPRKTKIVVRWISGIMLGLFIILFLPWQQNIETKGTITALNPQDRPQSVPTFIAGRIEKWYISEGEFVKKDDTIAVISEIKDKFLDPQILSRFLLQIQAKKQSIQAKNAKIDALNQQLAALQNGLQMSLNKAKNKFDQASYKVRNDSIELLAQLTDYQISQRQYQAQEKLYQQGLKSLTELETRKAKQIQEEAKKATFQNKLSISQNEKINALIELSSIRADYNDKIAKSASEKALTQADLYDAQANLQKLTTEYENMKMRAGQYVIKAPQDGTIIKASKEGLGETVKEGDEIVTIMPDVKKLAVVLYVKPMDIPLLHVGSEFRLQFDGWPALVFSGWPNAGVGTFGGKVAVIDKVSFSGNKFRIIVVPDEIHDKWPDRLQIGSGVYGWAMLNNVMIGHEIWRQFNGFPPDFITDVPNAENAKNKDKKDKSDND